MSKAALDDITIVDFTQFESGAICTMMLAWLGADVIKIEKPGGDPGRAGWEGFAPLNCNKRSIVINLKKPEGKDIVWQLIRKADVLVENYAPGVIERLGFDYETVRSVNPRLIFAQVKGFGSDGPYANYPAFDPIGQATGVSASINGERGGAPMQAGVDLADAGAGVHMTTAILAALYQRSVTGLGQRIEVAMQDVCISLCRSAWEHYLRTGRSQERVGNGMPLEQVAPSNLYPCKPGGLNDYVHIYTSRHPGSRQWQYLLQTIDRLDLLEDPRLATPQSRFEHREEIDEIISTWTRRRTKQEAMDILCKAGVPAGAVLTTEDISNDEYLLRRGTVVRVEKPDGGSAVIPGNPLMMSESKVPVKPPPELADSKMDVLAGLLGLSEEEIKRLEERKVV